MYVLNRNSAVADERHIYMRSSNNLFAIRKYWAAFSVLMLHYVGFWRIFRGPHDGPEFIFDRVTAFPPVVIFLAISGFLIAGSLERSSSIREFYVKRIRRVYVPLWISIIIYMAVYLVIAREYMDGSIVKWILASVAGLAYTPDCLKDFASGSANGVLWTITVLIELYIISGFLWRYLRRLSPRTWIIIVFPVLIICNVLSEYASQNVLPDFGRKILERSFLPYAFFYFIGFFVYLYRDHLGWKTYLISAIAFVIVILMALHYWPDYGYYTGVVRGGLTAVITVVFGSWSPKTEKSKHLSGFCSFLSRHDITYEVYLYQWLVFNVMICLGLFSTLGWIELCFISLVAVTLVAVLMNAVYRRINSALMKPANMI